MSEPEFTPKPERRHPLAAVLAFGGSAALIGLVVVAYVIFIR